MSLVFLGFLIDTGVKAPPTQAETDLGSSADVVGKEKVY